MGERATVTAWIDVGPIPVDVDWGDGGIETGMKGRLWHVYTANTRVTVTLTDQASGLKSSAVVSIPGPPPKPKLTFDRAARKARNGGTP